jgi:ribose 5-phosphate isomerase RpiB
MIIAMGGDHAGYTLKSELRTYLLEKGYGVDGLGHLFPGVCGLSGFCSSGS